MVPQSLGDWVNDTYDFEPTSTIWVTTKSTSRSTTRTRKWLPRDAFADGDLVAQSPFPGAVGGALYRVLGTSVAKGTKKRPCYDLRVAYSTTEGERVGSILYDREAFLYLKAIPKKEVIPWDGDDEPNWPKYEPRPNKKRRT